MINRIAFTGLSGVGKDEAARPLLAMGFVRHCFGDIIKREMDSTIQKHFGFSAFTENRDEKARIRRTLESWGEDRYDTILSEYFAALPEKCVNTRLIRIREAEIWRQRGGIVVCIHCPGVKPATQWEQDRLNDLRSSKLIDVVLCNDGDVERLHRLVLAVAEQRIEKTV